MLSSILFFVAGTVCGVVGGMAMGLWIGTRPGGLHK
jgi:hypothetical protein